MNEITSPILLDSTGQETKKVLLDIKEVLLGIKDKTGTVTMLESDAVLYSSLSAAVTDINNGTDENKIEDATAAKVKVFEADNGRRTVMLLTDVTESTTIVVNKDVDLVLAGHTLAFTAATTTYALDFAAGTSCTIDGRVEGSRIEMVGYTASGNLRLVGFAGKRLTVLGGECKMEAAVPESKAMMAFYGRSGAGVLSLDGCTVDTYNTYTAGRADSRCVQTIAEKVYIKNSTLSVKGSGNSLGVYAALGDVFFENTSVVAEAFPNSNYSGVLYGAGLLLDAMSATDIVSAYVANSNFTGTHSGTFCGMNGRLYIDGGTYAGGERGGLCLGHGELGIACVNDAKLCGDASVGGFYVGNLTFGGTAAANTKAYFDGCVIGTAGKAAFTVGSDNGKTGNTVNISNSKIADGALAASISSGNSLNVGIGSTITGGTQTEALYRKKHPAAVLNGKDFEALANYVAQVMV